MPSAGAEAGAAPAPAAETDIAGDAEVAAVAELFPDASGYVDTYDRAGLLGPRSVLAHNVHAPEVELKVLAERDIVLASTPLETSDFVVDGTRWSHVVYESGLIVNVMYALEKGGKRAVGFKLSDGMDVPVELDPHHRPA